jgi:hypothetical protein
MIMAMCEGKLLLSTELAECIKSIAISPQSYKKSLGIKPLKSLKMRKIGD